MLKFAAICPHQPIIIPSIGRENLSMVSSTVQAMKILAKEVRDLGLETIVVISPHGPYQTDFMTIIGQETLEGDFLDFGADDISMKFANDTDLALSIKNISDSKGVPAEILGREIVLDHGSMVPLYFLTKHVSDMKIVPVAFSELDYGKHLEFGKAIYEAIENTDRKVGLVASGDLSHRLTPDAPAGYSPSGKKFDSIIVELLEAGKTDEVLRIDSNLIEEAGECGLRSIIIALGAISNSESKFEKLSYEGPFGVGYLVGRFLIS